MTFCSLSITGPVKIECLEDILLIDNFRKKNYFYKKYKKSLKE